MEIKLETYEDLESHLLATMDSFTDQKCVSNSGITKEWYWNLCMGICMKQKDKQEKIGEIIKNNVLREFPYYFRDDYLLPEVEPDSPELFREFFFE